MLISHSLCCARISRATPPLMAARWRVKSARYRDSRYGYINSFALFFHTITFSAFTYITSTCAFTSTRQYIDHAACPFPVHYHESNQLAKADIRSMNEYIKDSNQAYMTLPEDNIFYVSLCDKSIALRQGVSNHGICSVHYFHA